MNQRTPIAKQVEEALADTCMTHTPEPAVGQKWRYVAAIREVLEHPPNDLKVIERAAIMLGRLGGEEAQELLAGLLDHSEATVRSAALTGLRTIGEEANARLAARLLKDPVPGVRKEAIKTLAELGDSASQKMLSRHAARESEGYLSKLARGAAATISRRSESAPPDPEGEP